MLKVSRVKVHTMLISKVLSELLKVFEETIMAKSCIRFIPYVCFLSIRYKMMFFESL